MDRSPHTAETLAATSIVLPGGRKVRLDEIATVTDGAARKATARHGTSSAWLWAHENVPGNGHDKGGRCHLLAHVPADLQPGPAAL